MNSVAGEVSAFTKERCARALRVMHLGKLIPIVSKNAQTIARCQDCRSRFFWLDIPKEIDADLNSQTKSLGEALHP